MRTGPEFISRYRIVRPLGQGGMGTLYLAEDPSLDRLIAIKLLKDDSDELRQRFIREARTAGRLKHVNIVSIFDVGEFDNQPFIAMEYIPGETLGEIIKRRAPLPLTRKLILMEELCAGLAHAHRSGIVHRDVKPANIMLDAEGTLKVLDFGIARWESSGMTRSGVIMGSLNYMSPEVVAGRAVDQRSDVFAVGSVVYEFLSYLKAFPGGLPEVLTRILHSPPDQFDAVAASLDPEIGRILERALAKDPADRYQDLGAMRKDLQSVRQSLEREADETLVLRSGVVPAATDSPSHAAALADAVAEARSAIDAVNIDATRTAIDRARHLGVESHIILSLQDRLADILNLRQSQEWADEARQLLADGGLTAAYDLARRAELLTPDDPQVATLLGGIERARAQRDGEHTRRLTANRELGRARSAYDDGAFELAARIADGVLALDPANDTARTLKVQAADAAERRGREQHDEAAQTAVAGARALFDAGSRDTAIGRLRAFAPHHAIVDAAIRAWTEELDEINRQARRSRARALLQAGRTAIAREDFRAAATALDDLRGLPADAGDETAALSGELQRARTVVLERERTAAMIARIETALNDRQLDAVESLWRELPPDVRDSSRVRPLLDRWQASQSAAELARRFDEAFARAAAAFGDRQLDPADAAVRDALRLRPDDEPALDLRRRIREARGEQQARALIADAEERLSAGDLDRAASSLAQARALDAAHEAVDAVEIRIDSARRAVVEANRRRTELADSARTAIVQEDFAAAAAALETLRQLTPIAGDEAPALAIELQRAREAVERRQRAAETIAQIEAALDDQRLDAADALLARYREAGFDPEPVRGSTERGRALRRAADLVEKFDTAFANARSAVENQQLDLAGPAIDEALGVRPQDEAAVALKRTIAEAVAARDAAVRAAALRRAVDDGARAIERGELDTARAAIERALGLDANDADAGRLARQIADAERRAAAEREARRLIAAAELRLKTGDLDGAEKLIDQAREIGAAAEAADAVAVRIRALRQAAAEEDARRRAVASGLEAAKVAVADRRLEDASARLGEVRAIDPANRDAATLSKQVAKLARAEAKARERAARPPTVAGGRTSLYLTIAGLVLALGGAGLYFTRTAPSLPREDVPSRQTSVPPPPTPAAVPEKSAVPDRSTEATPTPAPPTAPPVAPAPPPSTPVRMVAVDSTPWGRVTIRPLTPGITLQKPVETTPFVVNLPEGDYEFVLAADALPKPYAQRVQVTSSGPATVRLVPPSFDPAKIVSDILGARQP